MASVMKAREIVRLPVIPEPRSKISYSEWMMFRSNCEWRWYLDYVLKIRKGVRSIALEFGTAMHVTLEEFLHADRSERISVEEACERFAARLWDAVESLQRSDEMMFGPWPEDKDQWDDSPWAHVEAGTRILRYIATVPDLYESQVVRLEFEINDQLDRTDSPISFRGFVDFVAVIKNKRNQSVLIVGDFKTCKWGWHYEKKQDPDVLAQPRLYKHFICKQTGMDPRMVRTYFFLMKKRPRKKDREVVEQLQIPSSERDIQRTIESMQSDITRMRSGQYERNRESCVKPWGMCPHYGTEHCPKIEES